MIRCLKILCGFALLIPAYAQEDPLATAELSALNTTIDPDTNAVTLTGDAQLTNGNALLEADEIRYLQASNLAIFTGNVRITDGADRILADKITFNRADQSFTGENVRVGRYPLYMSGDSVAGNLSEITITNALVSGLEPAFFHPSFSAKSLTYLIGEEITAESPRVGFGEIRPIILPQISQRVDIPLVSYMSMRGGFRSSLGAYAEAQVHIPVADGIKVGGLLGGYTARGITAGPSGDYDITKDDGREIAGNLQAGFINDHGDKLTDLLGRPVPENRGYAQWWHAQDLTDDLRITAKLNYWRDSEILRDFRPQDFFDVQAPDNYLQAVYTGSNYLVTAFTRVAPNDFHRVQERLPEIHFDLLPHAMGHGFNQRFHASYAALREESLGGIGPTTRSDRLDAYYAVSKTISHEDWFSFTPMAGARVTHYQRATGGKDTYTRTLGEVGFDLSVRTSSVSSYQNKTWKIDGIRHLFTPRLAYRYVPEADKGRAYIPSIDRLTFRTYLPPIGLGDTRNIDDLGPTNVLRLGFDNTWQTRDLEYGSRDLLVFNVATDFRFDRLPGQRTASDIHNFIAFTPAPWLQFNVYQRVTPEDFTMQEINTSLSIFDGRAWSVRFSSHSLRNEIEEYILQTDVRLNEAYEVLAKLHYDTRRNRFNEQAYGLRQNLGNLWSLEYLVTIFDGPRRESDFGISISVDVIGF